VETWSPAAAAYDDLDRMLADTRPDAIFNLTPAPAHGPVSHAALESGAHVYSEKPIASSIAEADRLITLAAERALLLLCAPAVAVSRRFAWLAEIVRTKRFGALTLAVAHHADPGPAAWREYTGDPSVFYSEGVGPVFDHGIYRLHEMTMLMGPVRRVQAMGSIGSPQRVVRGGPLAGRTIEVTTPDHVLIQLEFVGGGLGQLLASFGTAATLAPWLELHFTDATISFGGAPHDKDAPASIYVDDVSQLGLEGWMHGVRPPHEPLPVVESGAVHFVACLLGNARPVLTGEHARHVLDVILKAYESIADGRSHETETTF
jgi:predicted dehydrogenase